MISITAKIDEPFFSYWNSKNPLNEEKQPKKKDKDHHEDEQYRALKKAIRQEAIKRWSET
ncbi:hypothetical protein GN156_02845 [bacterium LRH843]|nr:hypothetical protein [bacterium LRH843]